MVVRSLNPYFYISFLTTNIYPHIYRNPINGVKYPKAKQYVTDNPKNVAYWQKGVGAGGELAWKFNCSCGEKCSSYENYRYHPTGRMFECAECSIWSHVDCVFGSCFTDEDLEELPVI